MVCLYFSKYCWDCRTKFKQAWDVLEIIEIHKVVFNLFKRVLVKKQQRQQSAWRGQGGGTANMTGSSNTFSIWTLAQLWRWAGRQQIAGHSCNLFWIQCLGDCSLQPICATRVSEVVRRWMRCFRRILTLLRISITCPSIFDLASVQT